MKWITALLFVSLLFASPASAEGLKLSKPEQRAFNSTLALYRMALVLNEDQLEKGVKFEPRLVCSATVIGKMKLSNGLNRYTLLAAGHCVLGDFVDPNAKYLVTPEINNELVLQPVRVMKAVFTDRVDFANLEFDSKDQYAVVPIEESDETPAIGEKVFATHFSMGLTKQIARGEVASGAMGRAADNGKCGDLCEGRYVVHIFQGPGSSGAAIINERGNIVGIIEYTWPGGTVGAGVESMKDYRAFLDKAEGEKPKAFMLSRQYEPSDRTVQVFVAFFLFIKLLSELVPIVLTIAIWRVSKEYLRRGKARAEIEKSLVSRYARVGGTDVRGTSSSNRASQP